MNMGTKTKGWEGGGGAPEINAFPLINKSLLASYESKHLTNLDLLFLPSLLLQSKELFGSVFERSHAP